MQTIAVTLTNAELAKAHPVIIAVLDAMEAAEGIDTGTLAEYVSIMEAVAKEANARAANAHARIAQGHTV